MLYRNYIDHETKRVKGGPHLLKRNKRLNLCILLLLGHFASAIPLSFGICLLLICLLIVLMGKEVGEYTLERPTVQFILLKSCAGHLNVEIIWPMIMYIYVQLHHLNCLYGYYWICRMPLFLHYVWFKNNILLTKVIELHHWAMAERLFKTMGHLTHFWWKYARSSRCLNFWMSEKMKSIWLLVSNWPNTR